MAWQFSDTTRFCTCGWLERAATEPDIPIEFDERLKEYNLVRGKRRGGMILRYCPFCGCKAPESRRASLFEHMTDAEVARLSALTKGIRTLEDARRILGEPDEVLEEGGSVHTPEGFAPPQTQLFGKSYRWHNLSKTTTVIIESPAQEQVSVGFFGKPKARP